MIGSLSTLLSLLLKSGAVLLVLNEIRSLGLPTLALAPLRGGIRIHHPNAGCTGGFIANRGASYGITTSAHCTSKPATYDGDTTGTTYVASNNRDVRFTTLSGDTPQNQFRYNFGLYRTITSTGIVTTLFGRNFRRCASVAIASACSTAALSSRQNACAACSFRSASSCFQSCGL